MSTTFYVWYPEGGNVGHASIKIGSTYMSWWPKMDSLMESIVGLAVGTAFITPTYQNDVTWEGKEPDYVGDHFGWDDIKAIQFWNTQCVPSYAHRYNFVTCNCASMVVKILRASGALDGEVALNTWLGIKDTYAISPPDIMRVSQYFAGHKAALIY
jgi:hypothetical protein